MSYSHLTITDLIKIETYLELGLTPELKKEIEDGLKSSWSPEQICGRYQLEQKPMVAFKTIYNWLYACLIDLDLSVLRRKGKSRQPKETRGTFRICTSIAKRPKEVRNHETFGLWRLFQRQKQGLFSDLSGAKNALLLSFQDTRQNSQIHIFSHQTTL